jgi:RND family efflux transporter MFP subunit
MRHEDASATWRPSRRTTSALLFALFALLVGAFLVGYVPLQRREATLRAEADARDKGLPRVTVLRVTRGPDQDEIRLSGTMQALKEAPILARTDGYLKNRLVDIGDRVREGQVLAEIDAPELDQQVRQAEAAFQQAEAASEQAEASLEQGKVNRNLARIMAERSNALAGRGIVAQQDNDQTQAQLAAQDANVQALQKAVLAQQSNRAAAKANLARVQELQGYRQVRAPFDGVITLRNVDVGVLVTTGNTLLYRIAQTGTLRTYVNVAQGDVNSVHVGQRAALTVSNLPGRSFPGTVARMAKALDPVSRTMLVEVDLANPDGVLFPGTFADVSLSGHRENRPLTIPATAVVFRTDGAQVAIVQPDDTVHLQKITLGRDFGDRVEIVQGLSNGAIIIAQPGDTAREGSRIVPVSRDAQP